MLFQNKPTKDLISKMKRPLKILMIIFVIIAFSSFIVNLVAMFYSRQPIYNFIAALVGIVLAFFISQDISDKEPEIIEDDETFLEN